MPYLTYGWKHWDIFTHILTCSVDISSITQSNNQASVSISQISTLCFSNLEVTASGMPSNLCVASSCSPSSNHCSKSSTPVSSESTLGKIAYDKSQHQNHSIHTCQWLEKLSWKSKHCINRNRNNIHWLHRYPYTLYDCNAWIYVLQKILDKKIK